MMPSNTHRNAENKADRLERTNAPIYQVLLEPRKHVQHKKMKLNEVYKKTKKFWLFRLTELLKLNKHLNHTNIYLP